jgi:hypothetical protein
MWLGNEQFAAGANHAMPGDRPTARAGRHRVSRCPRAASQAQRFREFSVRCYAPARNSFHQFVDWIPGHAVLRSPAYRIEVRQIRRISIEAGCSTGDDFIQPGRQIKHLNKYGGFRLGKLLSRTPLQSWKAFVSAVERSSKDAPELITDSKQPPELWSIVPLTG